MYEISGDRHLGDALGECQGGSSLIGMQNDSHESGWWHWGGVQLRKLQPGNVYPKFKDYRAFPSCVMLVIAGRAYTGEHINIMVEALLMEDGSLLQGLTVQNMYMELRQGSKKVVMVVRNSTAYLQTLWKKTPVARAVAALRVPEPPKEAQLQEEGYEPQDPHTPKMTVRQRHGKLFDELDLSGLDSWPPELADAAHWLLAEYHDVFSLDPAELGCNHSTEDMIKVTDDTPFKEPFRQIPPLLVEEVWNHLQEMLESGTIRPSQSVWSNA